MKLPANVRYAVRILLELDGATEPVATAWLAEKLGLSLRAVENIHGVLREHGITSGTVGARGGINLLVPLAGVSLGRLIALFDDPIEFTVCCGEKANDCPNIDVCTSRAAWSALSKKLQKELDNITLNSIRQQYPDLPLGLCSVPPKLQNGGPEGVAPPMRRKDRRLSDEDTHALLARGEYGVLSLITPEGHPYGVPLSYVWTEGRAYFHCALTGRKIDALQVNMQASFVVTDAVQAVYDKNFTTLFESAMLYGPMREVTEEAEKQAVLLALAEKYLPDHMDKAEADIAASFSKTAVYALEPDWISGKAKRLK